MKTILIIFTFIVPTFSVAQAGYNNFSIKSYPTHQLRLVNVNGEMDNRLDSLITENNFVSSLIEKQVKELPLSNAKVNEIQKFINNDFAIYAPTPHLEKEIERKWFVYETLASMPGGGGGGGGPYGGGGGPNGGGGAYQNK